MSSFYPILVSIAAATAGNASTATVTTQSLDAVRDAAAAYVRTQLPPNSGTYYVTAGTLDSRLDCGRALGSLGRAWGSLRRAWGIRRLAKGRYRSGKNNREKNC